MVVGVAGLRKRPSLVQNVAGEHRHDDTRDVGGHLGDVRVVVG